MAVNDCYQLNVVQLIAGRECTNYFYYYQLNATALTPLEISTGIVERFFALLWLPEWAPRVSRFVELSAIWARRMSPAKTDPFVQPYVLEFGSQLADPIPNGSCVLMSLAGGTASFVINRRVYISGLAENHQEFSRLVPSAFTGFRIFALQLRETVLHPLAEPALHMAPAAFSPKADAAGDPVPFEALLRSSATSELRSQRRRNIPS